MSGYSSLFDVTMKRKITEHVCTAAMLLHYTQQSNAFVKLYASEDIKFYEDRLDFLWRHRTLQSNRLKSSWFRRSEVYCHLLVLRNGKLTIRLRSVFQALFWKASIVNAIYWQGWLPGQCTVWSQQGIRWTVVEAQSFQTGFWKSQHGLLRRLVSLYNIPRSPRGRVEI